MSMTKRYIGDLQEKAAAGDGEAIETLTGTGLWETEEEHDERAAWEAFGTDGDQGE